MGVFTTADEIQSNLDVDFRESIEKLHSIQEDMIKMVDSDTWGGNDWNSDYRRQVMRDATEIQSLVLKLREIKVSYE